MRSESSAGDMASRYTSSTAPAIVVFRPSVEKREIRRMPETPLVNFTIVGLADAERGDHADSSHGDDRAVKLVPYGRGHDVLLQSTRSTSAKPSPRQLPTLVTTTCERSDGLVPTSPAPTGAGSLLCSSAAQAIPRLLIN